MTYLYPRMVPLDNMTFTKKRKPFYGYRGQKIKKFGLLECDAEKTPKCLVLKADIKPVLKELQYYSTLL